MARPRPSMTMDEAWLATMSQQLRAARALRDITPAGEYRYLRLAAHSPVRAADLLRAKDGPALPAITAFHKEIEKDAAFLGLDLDPKDSPEAPMIVGGSWDTPDALIEPRFVRRARCLTNRLITTLKAALPDRMEPNFAYLDRTWHEPMGVLGWHEILKPELDQALAERAGNPALALRLFNRVIEGSDQGVYAVRDYAQGEIEEWEAGARVERLRIMWGAEDGEDLPEAPTPETLAKRETYARKAFGVFEQALDIHGMDPFGLKAWILAEADPAPSSDTPDPAA